MLRRKLACAQLADTMKGLSRERVAGELLALLSLPDPAPTVARMREAGVLPVILPEAGRREVDTLAKLVAAERDQSFAPDPIRRLAALLPPICDVAEATALRLRLSRAHRSRISCAADRGDIADGDPVPLAYWHGDACAIDRLLIAGRDARMLVDWEKPIFPLKGGEMVAQGVSAGPAVARILQTVERAWVAENFPDRARVMALLQRQLAEQK